MATAMIFKSGVLRTSSRAVSRPAPTLFYFPGLYQRPWHDALVVKGLDSVVAATPAIRAEYEALVKGGARSDYTAGDHALHRGDWKWHSFVQKGERSPEFAASCPVTAAALDALPGFMTSTPFSFAFFSTMAPGSAIAPHAAPCNLRLRVHLPLTLPPSSHVSGRPTCGMRVGNEAREWRVGQAAVFDDSYEHETWHDGEPGSPDRVLLLFDIWHPELTLEGEAAGPPPPQPQQPAADPAVFPLRHPPSASAHSPS
jgi:aspartyl/asparaginyl beta-hydroxylase (cupin superfamily)